MKSFNKLVLPKFMLGQKCLLKVMVSKNITISALNDGKESGMPYHTFP